MVAFSRFAATSTAFLLASQLAGANPVLLPRKEDPLGSAFPGLTDRGVCVANDYSSDESRKNVWNSARGGELIDTYLSNNSRDYWVTNIWKELFPGEDAASFSCIDQASQCSLSSHTCSDFTQSSMDGLYQVYKSLSSFHTFVDQYLQSLDSMCSTVDRNIAVLAEEYGREADSKEPLNIPAIFSGALSIGATASAANPAAAGILGGMSGIAGLVGTVSPTESGSVVPEMSLTKANLYKMLDQTCTHSQARITRMLDAVMGKPGSSELDIPVSMVVDEGKGWNHRIAWLFGDGQYLTDHPTQGVSDNFKEVEKRMKQAIAFQLLRLQHQAAMVINTGSPCDDGNEVRDPNTGDCYGLMRLSDDRTNLEGGLNDPGFPLWAPESEGGLGMDKLATYRNTLDCWKSNGARMGDVVPNDDPTSQQLPKCTFGMEVKKGKFISGSMRRHHLELDEDFPNFPEDFDGQTHRWPAARASGNPSMQWKA